MEIKPGMVELGDVTRWLSGGTPNRSKSEYWQGDIPWISASTLKSIEIFKSDQCVTKDAVVSGSKMAPIDSTLLLVRGSALHNEIRAGIVRKPVCFNQDVKALIPNKKVYPKYLTYSILGKEGEILKLVSSAGNTAGVLDTKLVKSFKIWLPKYSLQQAIAETLSDVDDLITALDVLIAKKQALKKGTMQQLLTGKKRLPGFSGEWEVKRLGEVGKTFNGLSGKSKSDFGKGNRKYIPFLNVMNNAIIDINNFHDVHVKQGESQSTAKKGDLFFNTSSETPEEVGMSSVLLDDIENLHLNSFCFGYRLITQDEIYPLFLAYYFRSQIGREHMLSLAQGSTRYNLSKTTFLKTEIELPGFREQESIAAILTEMDQEIQALQQKRNKYKQIKQGMMQELLTGKTRLE